MNLSSNVLGLGNAATPFGLRAMKELEKMNRTPGVASNDMITLVVINCTLIQLLPTTLINLRIAAGSPEPMAIVLPSIIATAGTMAVGVDGLPLAHRKTMGALSAYAVAAFIATHALLRRGKKGRLLRGLHKGREKRICAGPAHIATLVGMLTAVSVLHASGLLGLLHGALRRSQTSSACPQKCFRSPSSALFGNAALGVLLSTLQRYGTESRMPSRPAS
jgi:hypothetical protein